MNDLVPARRARGLVWLYARLLRLYPRRFREQFAGEMAAVFALAVADAAQDGPASLLRLCLRELRDWPGRAIQEHWRERTGRKAAMKMKLWPDDEARVLDGMRRLARTGGLVLSGMVLLAVASPNPPQNPGLIVLLLVTHSVAIAWFRERLGGRLLIGGGLALGLTAFGYHYYGQTPPPGPEYAYLRVISSAVIGLTLALPVVAVGVLFLIGGQRSSAAAGATTGERYDIRPMRAILRVVGLALTAILAWTALQILAEDSLALFSGPVYAIMALMPVGAVLALRREKLGGALILCGAGALGLAAGGSMAGYGASAMLDAAVLYALPYGVIGLLYVLVGRRAEVPSPEAQPAAG